LIGFISPDTDLVGSDRTTSVLFGVNRPCVSIMAAIPTTCFTRLLGGCQNQNEASKEHFVDVHCPNSKESKSWLAYLAQPIFEMYSAAIEIQIIFQEALCLKQGVL
jgi:hypothetical protein